MGKGGDQVTLKILHSNIRGFTSKQTSLSEILEREVPDIVNLNETNMKGNRKINLKKYVSFSKNSVQNCHGISTSFASYLKDSSVKVSEDTGGVDEFMVTRLESVEPALNIINIYGAIEERAANEDILESWMEIKKELNAIKQRGESVLVLGDLNRAVGNDSNGVAGNKKKISYGGSLVRELVESGDYVFLNNHKTAEGGPWTREDPAHGTWSCLDLAIGSTNLNEGVVSIVVDEKKKFTPFRAISTKDGLRRRHTDHLSIMIELRLKNKIGESKKEVKWNTSNPEGWNNYSWMTNLQAGAIKKICEEEESIDEAVKKLKKIDEKVRFSAFGKTKIKTKKPKPKTSEDKSEEDILKEMVAKETQKIEEQIEALKKSNQGRVGKILKIREAISGPKKKNQEAIALKDSRSGDIVVSTSEIKRVTTEYCQDLFTNNNPDKEFEELNKVKHLLHEELMKDTQTGLFDVEEDDFWETLQKCKNKNKRSYDWITKAGTEYQEAMMMMIKRMIKDEEFPRSFDKTLLVQLHKAGSFQDLGNSRFIHMKEALPKITESLVVKEMKDDILEASSKYQIGGQPGMRTNFHLFVLKSMIGIKENSEEGTIITVADIEKFFDKESLVDCMVTLNEAQINHKCYRL